MKKNIDLMTLEELTSETTAEQRRKAEAKATAIMAALHEPNAGAREMVIASELRKMLKGR